MNQEQKDDRIRELFHELKQADERRAPGFASVMEAARLKRAKPIGRRPLLPVAVAAALLILAVGVAFISFKRPAETYLTQEAEPETPTAESGPPAVATTGPPNYGSPGRTEAVKPVRRRAARRAARSAVLISGWRSPTDFLLETAGQQLLREAPRLNESITSIEEIFPEEEN